MTKLSLCTGYTLPFSVCYGQYPLLSGGLTVRANGRFQGATQRGPEVLESVLAVFEPLAKSGALCGDTVPPGYSTLRVTAAAFRSERDFSFAFEDCHVDERALVVLCHLFLARCKDALLESLELSVRDERPEIKLFTDPEDDSTLPNVPSEMPFLLEDYDPESGGYTFTAELERPLEAQNALALNAALSAWVRGVMAGGYGLAPIPPDESYAEPDAEEVTYFDTTVEWTVFKVRADPTCVCGVVNIFAAFHYRYQAVRTLSIS